MIVSNFWDIGNSYFLYGVVNITYKTKTVHSFNFFKIPIKKEDMEQLDFSW